MKKKILLEGGLTILIASAAIFTAVKAGSLTPLASPAATSYTLSDIYTRLTTNATAVEAAHVFAPGGAPAGTLYTLKQIYNAIPTINAAKVLTGTSYLGVAGTAYGDTTAANVLTTASVAGTYNASNLSVGTVKSGTAFGPTFLTGAYPSAIYTLPSASATPDLATAQLNATTGTSYEWWQSDGTYQTAKLDFPAAASVCSNATVNGAAGTLTINATKVLSGTTYCGTAGTASAGYTYGDTNPAYVLGTATGAGTALKNLFNGTGQGFTGGSQANGGVDDYNSGGAAPANTYNGGWTQCASGNSYCGTSDSNASYKDNSTGLVWSHTCAGSGTTCTPTNDASPTAYSWTNAGSACSNMTGWSLPHQKQLMQAYIDGDYGTLEASGVPRIYWSATTVSTTTTYAWGTYLSYGGTTYYAETYSFYVRCVR